MTMTMTTFFASLLNICFGSNDPLFILFSLVVYLITIFQVFVYLRFLFSSLKNTCICILFIYYSFYAYLQET